MRHMETDCPEVKRFSGCFGLLRQQGCSKIWFVGYSSHCFFVVGKHSNIASHDLFGPGTVGSLYFSKKHREMVVKCEVLMPGKSDRC